MITTREAINYQYSIIFGYISSKTEEITVGDVIGPGNLTKEKIKNLYHEVIKFLNMYNAVLRDFTGSELFSIEFFLLSKDSLEENNNKRFGIYPKSMILLPGHYKESECMLLALKPELGILDVYKSKSSVDDICELFSEVEDFIENPKLNNNQKNGMRLQFASRFSKKLYGELIDKKWDKKLIGLVGSEPTSKDLIQNYATMTSNITIKWHKKPREVRLTNSIYNKYGVSSKDKMGIDYMKYLISKSSMDFIIENTLKFGIDLFGLCNAGTLDEIQDHFISYVLGKIKYDFDQSSNITNIKEIDSVFRQKLTKINTFSNKFIQYSHDFLISGEKGDLGVLRDKYLSHIREKGDLENTEFEALLKIAQMLIEQSLNKKKILRASEFHSILNYLGELFKKSYEIILKALPHFLTKTKFSHFINIFIKELKDNIKQRELNGKILINDYIEELEEIILEEIELNLPTTINSSLNEDVLIEKLKNILKQNTIQYFNDLTISFENLIDLIKEKIVINYPIAEYIENFRQFPGQIRFLMSYITKHSSMNRFLSEQNGNEIKDPVTFSSRFHRFLEKRLGGIELIWKEHVLNWIQEYAKQFFNQLDIKMLNLTEIVEDFLEYLDKRKKEELIPEGFVNLINSFIEKEADVEKREGLMHFVEEFILYKNDNKVFSEKIKELILENIYTFKIMDYYDFKMDFDSFYEYIKSCELLYYSQLIPLPASIILKHKLSEQEKELFTENLYHIINFKYWHNRIKYDVANNFKSIYKEWEKET